MKISTLKKSAVAVALAMAFTGAQAQSWVLSPDSVLEAETGLGFGGTVITGSTNQATIDLFEVDTAGLQGQGIYGAGFTTTGTSFSMNFDHDLYTWDSYSAPTGSGTGYFDAFIVTVSTQGYYWNSAPSDPVASSASTWVWGGANYNDGLESNVCNTGDPCVKTISLIAEAPSTFYVSVVLDTSTLPDSDTLHPSWGSFHVAIAPIPEPEIYAMMAAGLGLMGFVARRRINGVVS